MDGSRLYPSPSIAPRVTPARLVVSAGALRAALVAGCAVAIAAAALIGDPSASIRADPELAWLLRGMAVIKGLLVVAAAAILAWRFGHPIRPTTAAGYLVGASLIAGATALIWQLSFIVASAAVFHAGGLLLLVLAWRDDGVRERVFATRRGSRRFDAG